jgi:DAACS family dicarboxylate/amino acid:cation (Na+ or H+) symporter
MDTPISPSGEPQAGKGAGQTAPHTKILAGLLIGASAGVLANILWRDAAALRWVVDNIAQPVGQVFLRMLFMIVVPLVFTSLSLGVAGLGDLRRLGRVGAKTLGIFLLTTALASSIGLTMVNTIRPGESLAPEVRASLLDEFAPSAAERVATAVQTKFGVQLLVEIVPRNPVRAAAEGDMLALIFVALIFGVALTRLPRDTAAPVLKVVEGVGQAVMVIVGIAMKLAPFGVAGLVFSITARFGFGVVKSLGLYVIVVLIGLFIHQFGVIPAIARAFAGVSPRAFFRRSRALMVTAFSTSSSNATMPTTLRTAEYEFGVPREIAGFVIPLGATMNMNGTALFEGVTVLFLAQVFGVPLGLPEQIIVLAMTVLTAIGAAGVPSGAIPLLVMILVMVGVPGEAIALVLGVDRILDMCRTVPNVTGDLLTSLLVTRSEGMSLAGEVSGAAARQPTG